MENKVGAKKVLNIIKTVIVWVIFAIAAAMMIFTIVSVNTFDQNNRDLFGFKAFTVRTDSMSATDFDSGDIVFTKNVDPKTLVEGDVIAFVSQEADSFGETITHKIRRLTTGEDGTPGFITYGTTTDVDDEGMVEYEYVLGKYTGKIPNVGAFFLFLKEPIGYIMFIFIPFFILILYQGLNCVRLFRQYRKEQMQEMQNEREQIEKDKEETARMLQELQELKEQLAAQKEDNKQE